ncbi:MAG: phage tail protein [Pseudoxanthomonas sp.]
MADANKNNRPYISGRFVLELDDTGSSSKAVGTLQAIEGGSFKSEPVEEKVGSSALVMKYSGRPKFEDVTIQVGMAMAPRFWEWIKKSFNYEAERRNGALVALDFDNNERWRRTFYDALIKEVTFPTLDGAASEPAYLTVKFSVENIEDKRGTAKYPAEQEAPHEWNKQRLWLPSMFTFKVDGLSGDKVETVKMESFTIKQEVIDAPHGGILQVSKEPGRVDFPNLGVTILQRDADKWMQWWDEFVRAGNHQQSKQKNGHISFLTREAGNRGILTGNPLVTLDIYGMGILGVTPVKHDSKKAESAEGKARPLLRKWI